MDDFDEEEFDDNDPWFDDDEPIEWPYDRVGGLTFSSTAQINRMLAATEPRRGAVWCPGRVSVRLDGSFSCSSHCDFAYAFHREEAVADCCDGQKGPGCGCWHCLEWRVTGRELSHDTDGA